MPLTTRRTRTYRASRDTVYTCALCQAPIMRGEVYQHTQLIDAHGNGKTVRVAHTTCPEALA